MEDKEVKKAVVGVIGSGTMGTGIAQAAAVSGYKVILFDSNKNALDKARQSLLSILIRLEEKGKLSGERAADIFSRIYFAKSLTKFNECGIVIEAVVESLPVKKELFSQLENTVRKETILATNTSSLSVTEIASACKNPERVIGTHFFNPAPLMPLVEIIPGEKTSREFTEKTKKIINDFGKTIVVCKDSPGFIVNRIARPFYGEALKILEEGTVDVATIDFAMKEIGKFKMGPFELMDLIGNDVNYKVTETIYQQFNYEPRFEPSSIQRKLVEEGKLGKKTGVGFYNYTYGQEVPTIAMDKNLLEEIFFRILAMLINEAAYAIYEKIASVEDIDLAMTMGVNYPKGLLKWADEIGVERIVDKLNLLYDKHKNRRYVVCPLLVSMAKERKKFYE
ncbi:3-hydroxyacyl-CoA dehydrogenase NAD-binding domain-containing protein [Melioribacteraceae bacterium 4301-Me]|uniref:3-hydroxyacyl-CoA dehydrogenase NAD-binding domain-containing protein n=1 Tax=Pyranulibacter aquaticus TaxID=3163344 RepID=UPI00359A6AAB